MSNYLLCSRRWEIIMIRYPIWSVICIPSNSPRGIVLQRCILYSLQSYHLISSSRLFTLGNMEFWSLIACLKYLKINGKFPCMPTGHSGAMRKFSLAFCCLARNLASHRRLASSGYPVRKF